MERGVAKAGLPGGGFPAGGFDPPSPGLGLDWSYGIQVIQARYCNRHIVVLYKIHLEKMGTMTRFQLKFQ